MSNNISIGPLNIPSLFLFVIISFIISCLLLKLIISEKKPRSVVLNKSSGALIITLLVWKISPLFTDFSTVKTNISSLLYLPGSGAGLAAAIAAGLVYLAVITFKMRDNRKTFIKGSMLCLGTVAALSLVMSLGYSAIIKTGNRNIQSREASVNSLVLEDMEGNTVNLAEQDGKPVILNFWASWCPPCKAEIPELNDFYAGLDKQAVSFYSINLASTEKNPAALAAFISDYKINFPVLPDKTGSVSEYFNIRSVPTTIFLDKTGTELQRYSSAVSESILNSRIEKLK